MQKHSIISRQKKILFLQLAACTFLFGCAHAFSFNPLNWFKSSNTAGTNPKKVSHSTSTPGGGHSSGSVVGSASASSSGHPSGGKSSLSKGQKKRQRKQAKRSAAPGS